jgi:AraC-like DNA-binding protein
MQFWLNRASPRLNILWRGEWPTRFIEPPRFLYDHELVVVSQGHFLLQIGDAEWEMERGSFAIIPPNVRHVSLCDKGPVFRSCIHFDWNATPKPRHPFCSYFPKRPAARLVVRTPSLVPFHALRGTFDADSPILSLIDTIFLRWRNGDSYHRSLARAAFIELLVRLLHKPHASSRSANDFSQLAYSAKEILDRKAQFKNSNVTFLLKPLGYSYPHLCRLFHKSFGLSPLAYLNIKRLEYAKSLLRNPRPTIAEVAYQSGFQDPGYFTRQFRKQTGLTPREFRKKS